MRVLAVFGTSGFAREIADIAIELGYQVVLIARDQAEKQCSSSSFEIIVEGDDGLFSDSGTCFAIGVGDNGLRRKIACRYRGQLEFPTLIHPSATFGHNQREVLEHSTGTIVCAGVRITNKVCVGDFVILNLNATVGHDVIIGDYANISPGANVSGFVDIGPEVWIGTGATINQGNSMARLEIGDRTTVGSGAVVTKSCDSNAVYAGVPARRIK